MLTSGRFWVGVIIGVIFVYAWHMYSMRKGTTGQ
jgi:hypothetical protein